MHDHKKFLRLMTTPERGSMWQNVTGGVKKHESFYEGACREIEEETGLSSKFDGTLHPLNMTYFYFCQKRQRNIEEKCFLFEVKTPSLELPSIILSSFEHQAYDFFDQKDVNQQNTELFFYQTHLATCRIGLHYVQN